MPTPQAAILTNLQTSKKKELLEKKPAQERMGFSAFEMEGYTAESINT